jgi:hypothetical protein
VLARITIPVDGESSRVPSSNLSGQAHPVWLNKDAPEDSPFPMNEASVAYAFELTEPALQQQFSRNRDVFSALVQLYAFNEELLADLSNRITFMCKMQPPAFVFVSFAVELNRFMRLAVTESKLASARHLKFASSFVRHMCHVLMNTNEAKPLRDTIQDCVSCHAGSERDCQRSRLFHILLHSFAHNLASSVTLCFWAGAYRTTHMLLNSIDPLDLNLMFLLEVDRFIELLERPLFRHLHIRMLERDGDPTREGSANMLFQTLKALLMLLPQSTCYFVLRDRLASVSRFRQSAIANPNPVRTRNNTKDDVSVYLHRILEVRMMHCRAAWDTIRADSLELPVDPIDLIDAESSRSRWLGYSSTEEALEAQETYRREKSGRKDVSIERFAEGYDELASMTHESKTLSTMEREPELEEPEKQWTKFWQESAQVDHV